MLMLTYSSLLIFPYNFLGLIILFLCTIHGHRDFSNADQIVGLMNFTKAAGDLENIVAVAVAELENQTTQNVNNQTLHSATLVPHLSEVKTEEKIEENLDASSNSPLPLILISRVLNGIPQSPHFFQLRMYSELTREKLMVAWDQTFEDTAERIHDLKPEDNFRVCASKLWKTLEELQGMGYNVIPIRRRLVEMGEVIGEFKQRELEIVKLKNKAENHKFERSRFQSLILSFQQRAEREGRSMVQVLGEVDQLEKGLPKYGVLIANLAMKPFGC